MSSFILHNYEPFLHRTVMWDEQWILYNHQWWPAQWLDQEAVPKHFPKPNLHKKKKKKVLCHRLVVCCQSDCSFLNPSKTITSEICNERYAQQIEMRWKLQRLQPALVNRMGPVLTTTDGSITHPAFQKLDELGYEVMPHPPYSPGLLPTNYHFLQGSRQLFAGKMLPQPAGCRKCFPRVCWILKPDFFFFFKHGFLCYGNKQAFLIGKDVLTVMVPVLINKDVFRPGYDDFKSMAWNYNYMCTNLIYKYTLWCSFCGGCVCVCLFVRCLQMMEEPKGQSLKWDAQRRQHFAY